MLSPLPALVALALLAVLFFGCTTTTVYEPVDGSTLNGRKAMFLQPTYLPPLEESIFLEVVDALEEGFSRSTQLGGVVTRADFFRQTEADRSLRRDYEVLSNTLSVAGISERKLARALRQVGQVDLLLLTQLVFIPCGHCEESHRLALTSYVVEAETGKIVWRSHAITTNMANDPALLRKRGHQLAAELLELFEESVRLKWQRQRFANLAAKGRS